MPHALAVDQNIGAGVALDRVARLDMARAVGADDANRRRRVKFCPSVSALDRAAQDVNDSPLADGRLPKMQDVGQFGVECAGSGLGRSGS